MDPAKMDRHPANKKIDYRFQGKLTGHFGALLAISVREDGKFVAGGGTGGVNVWDLTTGRSIAQVPAIPDVRGATTVVRWIKSDDELFEALVCGTQGGYMFCLKQEEVEGETRFTEVWCRRMNDPAEITGVAFDGATNRLALCHRGGVFHVYTLTHKLGLKHVYNGTIPNCSPGSIVFGEMHGNEREVLIFGVHCGLVYSFRGSRLSTAAEAENLGCRIGGVAVDHSKNVICVDDPSCGVRVYHLSDLSVVNTLRVPVEKRPRVRQVALADSGRVVVSGSDHGVVYVHARRNSKPLAKLRVDPNDYVQTVAAADIDGVPTIFAAKSSPTTGANDIFVYRQTMKSSLRFASRVGGLCASIFWYIVVFAAMAYVYDRVGEQLFLEYFGRR